MINCFSLSNELSCCSVHVNSVSLLAILRIGSMTVDKSGKNLARYTQKPTKLCASFGDRGVLKFRAAWIFAVSAFSPLDVRRKEHFLVQFLFLFCLALNSFPYIV